MHDILINPQMPMHEHAQKMGVTLGTYTTVCKLMVKKGLVEIHFSRLDKRVKMLALTREGHDVVNANMQFLQVLINKIVKLHGVSGLNIFVNILDSAIKIMGGQNEN